MSANPDELSGLVGVEPVGDRWQVVFWEAKLARDGRARCRGEGLPKVVTDQLLLYARWLDHGANQATVAHAYQKNCRLLVGFHAIAKKVAPEIEDLGEGIRQVAGDGAAPLLVDKIPRLLIDDRKDDPQFTRDGHLKKLRGRLPVQVVQTPEIWALERVAAGAQSLGLAS